MAHRDKIALGLHTSDLLNFVRGVGIQMAVPAAWNLQVGDTLGWSCYGDTVTGTAEVVGIGSTIEEGMVHNTFVATS